MSESTTVHRTTHQVTGLTCGHCVRAVEQEVGAIAGVTDVHVELASGDVTVTSTHPIAHDELVAALDEAGYPLAR